MAPQAPWSPTAHAFAHHQFSHVANFWKQGRQASFRLEALPGGRAELNLTFQLPPASEVVPPPSYVPTVPAPQRPIHPLFPKGFPPQRSSDTVPNTKNACQKRPSSRQCKSYRRSVLHRAALAAHSLPPPKNGSLRQAAQARVQQLQAVSALPVNTKNAQKRPFSDSHSPSNLPPLAQRIRSDFQIGEESPEKELLRTQPTPLKSPHPISPCAKGLPPPAPLAFTPPKEGFETPVNTEVKGCEVAEVAEEDSDWETISEDCESSSENDSENDFPAMDFDSENWAEKYTDSVRRFHSSGNYSTEIDEKKAKCPNCDGVFTQHHQC